MGDFSVAIQPVRSALAALLAVLAAPALGQQPPTATPADPLAALNAPPPPAAKDSDSAMTCEDLAAEAERLKADMGKIGQEAVAASRSQAATQQGMAVGAVVAQGAGQVVPMGGLVAQGIVEAQQHQAEGAVARSGDRMQRMQTAYGRLRHVEALRAQRCAAPAEGAR
jgi:hypothetical protein